MPKPIAYPFLILATNSHEAVWLKVEGENKFTEILGQVDPKAHFTDNESNFRSISSDVNHEWEYETKQHLKTCSEKTHELVNANSFMSLVVAAPSELKNQLHEILKEKNSDITYTYLAGNFTHLSLHPNLVEEAREALQSF